MLAQIYHNPNIKASSQKAYSNVLKNIGISLTVAATSNIIVVMLHKAKSTKHLERIVRGFSNHRRIEIMGLLDKQPELSLSQIAKQLHINLKTAGEHVRRLAIAGHVLKRDDAQAVRHKLTGRGKLVLKFLRTLE